VFLNRVKSDLGLDFQVIPPEDEARLSVLGCASLMERDSDVAMVLDIGGGSTEMSWVKPKDVIGNGVDPPVLGWSSTPIGVVTLAEDEAEPEQNRTAWYEALVARLVQQFTRIDDAKLREAFANGRAHMIGTSGTVTSLAGVHLNLPRYERVKVDG
jgi:exopolyphosphatase/guanosine-5'-triphosphate,3'-diphosphate pyrophosphatase